MPPGAQYPDILRGIPISPTTFLSNLTEGAADGVAYSYTVYKVTACTVNASPASVRAYFAAHMPQHGWTQTSDFPDGYAGKCADHYCWTVSTGAKTARFVGLLNVQADNGNTVFVLDVLTLTYNS